MAFEDIIDTSARLAAWVTHAEGDALQARLFVGVMGESEDVRSVPEWSMRPDDRVWRLCGDGTAGAQAGDIVLATDMSVELGDGPDALPVAVLSDARVAGNATDALQAAETVEIARADDARRLGYEHVSMPMWGFDIERMLGSEVARLQKDTGLVAAWHDGKGDLKARVMAHTGSFMFHMAPECDGMCEAMGMSMPDEVGLWHFGSGRSWQFSDGFHEEWESGFDCDYAPATAADIAELGTTEAAMITRLVELFEIAEPPAGTDIREFLRLVPENEQSYVGP